jgi:hypothetical protein
VQLAPNYGALFAKKIYDLLIGLERAIPGYGKKIACFGEGFEGKSQEGEESCQEQNQEAWRHKGDVRSCFTTRNVLTSDVFIMTLEKSVIT